MLPSKPTNAQLVRAVRENQISIGTGTQGLGSAIAAVNRTTPPTLALVAKITNTGPNGEADYTDYRYWVIVQRNLITTDQFKQTDELDIEDRPYGGVNQILSVYNPNEYVAKTHSLATDTIVELVPAAFDQSGDGGGALQLRWLIVGGGGGASTTGTRQGQVNIMPSDSESGWDFPFGTEIP